MTPFTSRCSKRFIAVVMLLVWMFTLGANLANACMWERAGSEPAPYENPAVAASVSLQPVAMVSNGNDRHAPKQDSDEHALSHQVHCQQSQVPEHPPMPRQPIGFSFDLDAIVATHAHWAQPVQPTDWRPALRLRAGTIGADLPLFIRFRRLIP